MHVFISGIGGTGVGPLALIAKEAGYVVSGSDKSHHQYVQYLEQHGITNIKIGQTYEDIAATHAETPIDWFVYSSAIAFEQPDAPEFRFCREQGIKMTKRDELLNEIIQDNQLKLIAIAGTHGKTTTTAMTVWLFKQLNEPVSYLLPAKVSFGDMGQFVYGSTYFVYEADEFDRNFLAFEPAISVITGVSWDHQEIYPEREDYQEAFREFISQSRRTLIWQEDADYLSLTDATPNITVESSAEPRIEHIALAGKYNRLDAWLAIQAVHQATKAPISELIIHMNNFPGLQRRMEQLIPDLYTDYAHTPEKVRGAMSVALEMTAVRNQPLVVLYEPLTNRRQWYMLGEYKDSFAGVERLFWLPSYLAREDPNQRIIPPDELISHLDDPSIAEPAAMGDELKRAIQQYLKDGAMVVGMAGGSGGSLDEWLRKEFVV